MQRKGLNTIWTYNARGVKVGYGVTANIAASHAAARGSTPRIRVLFRWAFPHLNKRVLVPMKH